MPIDREKVLQAAQRYAEKKRFDRAIAEYQRILAEDSNDVRILLRVGDLQVRMAAFEDAVGTYERVAAHYAAQGTHLKAVAVYKEVRQIIQKQVPHLAEKYSHIIPKLGQLYQQLGLTGDALATFDEYATRLQSAGREREAIDVFRKIVELNGNNPLTRLRLAEALVRQNQRDEALQEFGTAARILLEMGRRDDALKVFERVLYERQVPEFALRAAQLYLDRGQPDDAMLALAKLQICFQADPRNLETLGLLARAFVAINQGAKAAEVRKEIVRLARDQGRIDLARETLEQLLREAPADEAVHALARSIMAEERKSTRAPPAAPPPAPPAPAPPDEATIEVSEEFVDPARIRDIAPIAASDSDYQELIPEGEVEEAVPTQAPVRLEAPPSVHHVAIDETQPAVEEVAPVVSMDAKAQTRDVLASVAIYRQDGLLNKALEALRIALEINPASQELHTALRDVLLDTGDTQGAINEMICIAAMAIDALDGPAAARSLYDVLAIDPANQRAREMLAELGYDVPPPLADAAQVPVASYVEPGASHEPAPQVEVPSSFEGYGGNVSSEPLPSYDLEEINASYALSSVPGPVREKPAAGLLQTDDPFGVVEPSTMPIDEPFQQISALGEAPLPSFPLHDEQHAHAAGAYADYGAQDGYGHDYSAQAGYDDPNAYSAQAGYADAYGQAGGYPDGAGGYGQPQYGGYAADPNAPVDYGQQHDPYAAPQPYSPLSNTRGFQGGDSLEDALEEADFFVSRNLLEDAVSILQEQLTRFPNHPLLLERLREVNEAMAAAHGGEMQMPQGNHVLPPPQDDHAFDIASSLAVLDHDLLATPSAPMEPANAVDVEEVFAKFKEGVKAKISESDSATHYDLGVAYKEMGLLQDAISEFELAARDPKRECVCWSMIAMVQLERGDTNAAVESLIRGLHAEIKTPEQELTLYYELGNIYQLNDNPREALYYFEKIERRDPDFRDVSARLRALRGSSAVRTKPTAPSDDELDRVFDDLFGGDHR